MYYDRTLDGSFSKRIEPNGDLRWLFDFVKENYELDFLIGKNAEWISVYRGLSRCITINKKGKIDGAKAYKELVPDLYANTNEKTNFQKELTELLSKIDNTPKFDRYYKNKKEGYYQNELSRKYGISSDFNSEFVIIDKEAQIGYKDTETEEKIFDKLKERYRNLQENISSINPILYGQNLNKKSMGGELDFLALDKKGNILLIEYKHGTNTSGIYLSPLQIGLYYDIFTKYYSDYKTDFENAIFNMLKQKQEIGLISRDWRCPTSIKEIIPVLIISEYNVKSTAKQRFEEIMAICRKHEAFGNNFLSNIVTYNYAGSQLKEW